MAADFLKLAFTPAGACDATLAIAACRAGGVGVLNAELVSDVSLVDRELEFLGCSARGDYGLKLDVLDAQRLALVARRASQGLTWLIVDARLVIEHRLALAELRRAGVRILAELSTGAWPSGSLGAQVFDDALVDGLDGVVLKGNESGGFVGELGSFVLFQRWRARSRAPLYLRGGVTPHVAAACAALGGAGVVLDSQLLLLNESPDAEKLAPLLAHLSGTETVPVGSAEDGEYFRLLVRPNCTAARDFAVDADGCDLNELRKRVALAVDWREPTRGLLPVGQDVCFANAYRERYGGIAALFRAIDSAVDNHLEETLAAGPLSEGGALSQDLGVRFPIVQGPMTRVSDKAEFADAISQGGALPMLALALVRGEPLERMLSMTRQALGDRPWGIGLLGFAPMDLMDAQVAAARPHNPDYAIIAGGRPDQAVRLEEAGIRCFLHVPSTSLLTQFVREGARCFIFEGRECGGHIGPLSSFTLWSSMVDRLCDEIDAARVEAASLRVLFAGGIHDAASSAMLQVLAAPLFQRGVHVGILMGSGYLFTKEIVSSRAVVPVFQQTMVNCERTVNLETGPGHASCCADTSFAREFFSHRAQHRIDAVPAHERRELLDDLILGRLRIASKGTVRDGENGNVGELSDEEQQDQGMYMSGQLVTLRDDVTDVESLHRGVIDEAAALLRDARQRVSVKPPQPTPEPLDIAIVGMASLLPQANSTREFWENILAKVNAISEIPSHRWDWRLYFDADRQAPDKIYSKWGGFLDDLAFDPTRYGIPPRTVESVDPMQLMALEVARRTLADAGYDGANFDRQRASVIIGASGGVGDVGMQYGLRSELPRFSGELPASVADRLPEWSEDTFAGILVNVIAGRIANRLNFGGVNMTTDAACASSLAAVYQAAAELQAGRSDFVIAGGVDTVQGPFGYLCFSKTQALSPRGQCRSFDSSADGIVISEGIVMLALKRLEDAERDGDRVYAVLKGIGASSDGRAKGLTAPLPAGQLVAMRRAYQQAGFGPEEVGLFEAHGTGTVAGDTSELESTTNLIRENGGSARGAVIGSVKTMIGHTKATAGVAGLVKAALALHHRVLPPQCHVDDPNPVLRQPDSPLYLLDEPRPWLANAGEARRSAVSSFGFGGTNFHAVLEEYGGEYRPWLRPAARRGWPAELFLFTASDRAGLSSALSALREELACELDLEPRDLARSLARRWVSGSESVAIVADGFEDLRAKLEAALGYLEGARPVLPPGVYAGAGEAAGEQLAVLFSGQGSQYPGMIRELAIHFPVCADALAEADSALAEAFRSRFGDGVRLSHFILPRGAYSEEDQKQAAAALRSTDVAQPALGAVAVALWRLLSGMGLRPDMLAGHSYGEFPALFAAGALSLESLMSLSEARGRLIVDAAKAEGHELGTMAAVQATREEVEAVIRDANGVVVANHNAPDQSIISGSFAEIEALVSQFGDAGINATPIEVAAAFHSRFVEPARAALAERIAATDWHDYAVPVYSNTTAQPHTGDAERTKSRMAEHLVRPVEFVSQIEAMYDAGARVFVELGPKAVLSGLTRRILGDRPHTAVAVDAMGGGIAGLLNALGQLLCAGVELELAPLFDGRDTLTCEPGRLSAVGRSQEQSKHAWLINGSSVRRKGEPEKQVGLRLEELGQATANALPTPQLDREQPQPAAPGSPQTTGAEQARPEQRVPRAKQPQNVSLHGGQQSRSRPALDPRRAATPSQSRTSTRSDRKEPNVGRRRRAPSTDASAVMTEYFEMMKEFLRTQEGVMASYLGAAPMRSSELSAGVQASPVAQDLLLDVPAEGASEAPPQTPAASVLPAPGPTPTLAATVQATPVSDASCAAAPAVPASHAGVTASAGSESAAVASFDREKLAALLLQLIEEKTGYPPDMVGMDQDLESELGIDSIKRVEIVGALLHALPSSYGDELGEDRSTLNRQATLAGMLDMLDGLQAAGDASPFDRAGAGSATKTLRHLPRFVVQCQEEELDDSALRRLEVGHFLLTRDRLGVADALAQLLVAQGCTVHQLEPDVLEDEHELLRWCQALEGQASSLSGVVHLAPLSAEWLDADAPLAHFRSQLQCNQKAFFGLLRAQAARLAPAAHVVSTSALGGLFGREGLPSAGRSLQGGDVGLLKSLHEEKPELRVRAIDLDPGQDAVSLAQVILGELELCGGRIEVGYPRGIRSVFKTLPATEDPTNASVGEGAALSSESAAGATVILATGGGKGITAEVLRELARPGVTLILQGRSVLPQAEAPAIASLPDAASLRAYFIDQVRSCALAWSPAQVQREVAAILSGRELVANLADFRARGAAVEYHAVDVCDEDAMRRLIDSVTRDHGQIEGVVHGAGVIEDKLLTDKSSESWSRVVETKVLGLLLLEKLVMSTSLRFFTVFSSVAGRYGNSGQTDYATANELMNRLCCQLRANADDRVQVRALCWGPWAATRFGAGMVSPEVEAKFAEMGVELVEPDVGRALFANEIRASRLAGPVEVVFGEGPWEEREAETGVIERVSDAADSPLSPLLGVVRVESTKGQGRAIHFEVDQNHLYLRDHQMDGKRILPAAIALEMIAEGVSALWPDWTLVELRDFRLLKGIDCSGLPRHLSLVLEPVVAAGAEGIEVRARLQSQDREGNGPPRFHYRALVRLGHQLPASETRISDFLPTQALAVERAYGEWLFHGPLFQVIEEVEGLSETGVRVRLRTSSPSKWLRDCDAGGDGWLFDPAAIDVAAQVAILWTRAYREEVALPAGFGRVVRFSEALPENLVMTFELDPTAEPHLVRGDAYFCDAEGRLHLAVKDMECVSSAGLNRLVAAGAATNGAD